MITINVLFFTLGMGNTDREAKVDRAGEKDGEGLGGQADAPGD